MHPIFMEDLVKVFALIGLFFIAILIMPYIIALISIKIFIHYRPHLKLKRSEYIIKLATILYIIEGIYVKTYYLY